jgi:6-phosphogluconolactonase
MGSPEVIILNDAVAVAGEAARRWTRIAQDAVVQRGAFTVALAGGSTPESLYHLMARPEFRDAVPWEHTQVFFGDERCVPPSDPRSNYRMALEALLGRVPLPGANIFRMRGELPGWQAAADYERTLRRVFRAPTDELPCFDLILLGMGTDGHTASLFPGMPALEVSESLAVLTDVPHYVNPSVARITLAFPVLNAASHVLFLVTGESKAAAARAALAGSSAPHPTPAGMVRPVCGILTWLLDADAASLMHTSATSEDIPSG